MSLSTLELSQLRADANDYFPDTCTIQTPTRTADAYGGWTESWADTHTGVSCRLAVMPLNRPEAIDAGRIASTTRWLLAVPYDQAIDATMRVIHDSVTYEVESVEDKQSHRASRHAYLRRVD